MVEVGKEREREGRREQMDGWWWEEGERKRV